MSDWGRRPIIVDAQRTAPIHSRLSLDGGSCARDASPRKGSGFAQGLERRIAQKGVCVAAVGEQAPVTLRPRVVAPRKPHVEVGLIFRRREWSRAGGETDHDGARLVGGDRPAR